MAEGDDMAEETEDGLVVKRTDNRVLRGGSFVNRPSDVRSAFRIYIAPADRDVDSGFRPARTFTP